MRRAITHNGIALLAGALTLGLLATPGQAAPSDAERAVTAVTNATTGMPAGVQMTKGADGSFTTKVHDNHTTIGADFHSLVVSNDQIGQLRMTLPSAYPSHSVHTSHDTLVRQGGDFSTAVRALIDGSVQATVILNNDQAPKSYSFGLELPAETKLVPNPLGAGGLDLMAVSGSAIMGGIAAPWAVDALGRRLTTYYELENNVLTQYIDTTGATYPVVADPTVTLGWYIYVRYNKDEVKRVAENSVHNKAKYLAILCATIPHPIIAAACALLVYDVLSSVASTFKSAANQNKCMEMRWTYNGWLVGWDPYSC